MVRRQLRVKWRMRPASISIGVVSPSAPLSVVPFALGRRERPHESSGAGMR